MQRWGFLKTNQRISLLQIRLKKRKKIWETTCLKSNLSPSLLNKPQSPSLLKSNYKLLNPRLLKSLKKLLSLSLWENLKRPRSLSLLKSLKSFWSHWIRVIK